MKNCEKARNLSKDHSKLKISAEDRLKKHGFCQSIVKKKKKCDCHQKITERNVSFFFKGL